MTAQWQHAERDTATRRGRNAYGTARCRFRAVVSSLIEMTAKIKQAQSNRKFVGDIRAASLNVQTV